MSGWRSGKSSQGGKACQAEASGAEAEGEKEAWRGLSSWSIQGILVPGMCWTAGKGNGEQQDSRLCYQPRRCVGTSRGIHGSLEFRDTDRV